ncbi:signal peptidase I [Deinococcus fonticola]|uniref:signal peptidase I n=1 Tax=Deinococcus fonticola TaxID=2528713 RepID=UPI0010757D48|nr:signal peptidase I [Deinococcus fonticola]
MQRVTPPQARSPAPWRDFWRTWVLGALLPVYLLTTFVATFARVNGESMAPTLHSGQLLLLLKYPRWLHAWHLSGPYLKRGDLVVFKIPADSPYATETMYGLRYRPYNVKRVVALAGDTVRIQGGQLLVNGRVVAEPYTSPEGYMNEQPAQVVPGGKVWVLGDNRRLGDSLDSRAYGPVSVRDVAGTANLRLWPAPRNLRPDQNERSK